MARTLVCTAVLATVTATAHAAPLPVAVEVDAAPGCMTEDGFWERLALFSRRASRAAGTPAVRVRAQIVLHPGGARGTVRIIGEGFSEAARSIEGADCNEVASALGLIAAIALDAPSPILPRPLTAEDRASLLAWEREQERRRPTATGSGLGWSAGAQGTYADASDAPPLTGLALWLEARDAAASLWAPAVRLGIQHEVADAVATPSGSARLQRSSASLEGCPLRWTVGSLHAVPCVRLAAGRMLGEGRETDDPARESRTWLGAGVVGRLRLWALDPVTLEMESGVNQPLLRYRFYLNPDHTAMRVGAPEWFVRAGAGFNFH